MLGLYHYDNAAGLEHVHQRIGDLAGHPLLDLGTPGVEVHEPGQLGQPGDLALLVRNVADVREPEEWRQVMLAGAVELDVADQDHLVVAGVEYRAEHVLGLLPQPSELLGISPGHAGRGVTQAVSLGILADGVEDLAHRTLDAGLVDVAGIALFGQRIPPAAGPPAEPPGAPSSGPCGEP